ncbi:hypothetical protein PQR62_06165 [Herbaspirillum lusitanum]|uniref:Uncharacterized protein n=1 Tax=Herbaspirillum lusitanum TaxID=213312 RepID=A0ABW9A5V6_9BURK
MFFPWLPLLMTSAAAGQRGLRASGPGMSDPFDQQGGIMEAFDLGSIAVVSAMAAGVLVTAVLHSRRLKKIANPARAAKRYARSLGRKHI